MKILNVPHKSISDVKQSPMSIFKEADETNNSVYIFNRGSVAGVMLTQEQYESINEEIEALNEEIEALYDQVDELIVKERLADPDRGSIPVNEVIGMNLDDIEFDENDGWE